MSAFLLLGTQRFEANSRAAEPDARPEDERLPSGNEDRDEELEQFERRLDIFKHIWPLSALNLSSFVFLPRAVKLTDSLQLR